MRKIIRDNWKEILEVFVFVFVMSYVAVWVSGRLQTDAIQQKVQSTGYWGMVIIILYIAASHIVAPLAGTPGSVVALSVYGLPTAWLLLYLGSLVSATINFYIARLLGRQWVIKLAGKRSINKVDRFVDIMGDRILIVGRLFGFPLYEFISYAVGLTDMSFRKYFVITAIASLIPGTITIIWMNKSLSSPLAFSIMMASMVLIGILFTWYVVRIYLELEKRK